MNRSWRRLLVRRATLSGVLLAAPIALTASCATNSDDAAPAAIDNPPQVLPDAASPDADAGTDGPTTDAAACEGASWCAVATNVSPFYVLKTIWGTGKDDVWAAGSGGSVVHYDGATWSPVPSGVKNTFNAVWGSGAGDVYVVGGVDAVFHSTGFHGGTATLTPLPIDTQGAEGARINAVWGTSSEDVRLGTDFVFFVDADGNGASGIQLALASADGGAPGWKSVPVDVAGDQPDTVARSIWGANNRDLWIAASQLFVPGREAIMYHGKSDDGGLGFIEVDSQSSNAIESIHGTSADDVWAVGSGGTIRHITAADSRWQVVASPTTETLHAVWASAPDDVWAVGDNATILHYDGKTFTPSAAELPAGRKPALYGIWGSAPGDVWIVGDAIALHHSGSPTAGTKP
jgi:hypothetical protein